MSTALGSLRRCCATHPLAEHVCELAASTCPELADLLLSMTQHRSATVRPNAITICLHDKPRHTVTEMLVRGLSDRSKLVRLKAADVILRTQRHELCPELRDVARREDDAEASRVFSWTADLLTKHWSRDPGGDVSVLLDDGGLTGLRDVSGASDTQIDEMVARLRR